MPNQPAPDKRRLTLAEHQVVVAALEEIARTDGVMVSDLVRQALRAAVRARAEADPALRERLRLAARTLEPTLSAEDLASHGKVRRYKGRSRLHDSVALETGIERPTEVQRRNSLTGGERPRFVRYRHAS